MTPDKIKKALECCSEHEDCHNCPCKNECGDLSVVTTEALNYIKQLESDLQLLKKDYDNLKNVAVETVERNQRLRNKLMKTLNDLKTIKSEAIKDFAEKVKLKFYEEFDELIPSIMADEIDNLVKEMVGGINDT